MASKASMLCLSIMSFFRHFRNSSLIVLTVNGLKANRSAYCRKKPKTKTKPKATETFIFQLSILIWFYVNPLAKGSMLKHQQTHISNTEYFCICRLSNLTSQYFRNRIFNCFLLMCVDLRSDVQSCLHSHIQFVK